MPAIPPPLVQQSRVRRRSGPLLLTLTFFDAEPLQLILMLMSRSDIQTITLVAFHSQICFVASPLESGVILAAGTSPFQTGGLQQDVVYLG